MTSDAKIGLLLGLVFIFAIAFIINGLPRFAERGGHSELTTNMAGPHKEKPIAANERAATKVISRLGQPSRSRRRNLLPLGENPPLFRRSPPLRPHRGRMMRRSGSRCRCRKPLRPLRG